VRGAVSAALTALTALAETATPPASIRTRHSAA